MIKQINCKLGNMKKSQDWVVYPISNNHPNEVTIQCDKRICRFNTLTQKGMLSQAHANGSYSCHLSPAMGAIEIDIPQEVIDAALVARPQSGDRIGANVFIA